VLDTSAEVAQETMYLNPGMYYINSTTEASATVSGLTSGTEYVIVVVAVDSEGNTSVADSWTFTY
jgi:hypothetical protein